MKYVVLLVLGFIIIMLGILFRWLSKPIFSESDFRGSGEILNTLRSDSGSCRFKIKVVHEGKSYEGFTIYYGKTYGKYRAGETVPLRYKFLKNGQVLAEIEDPELMTSGQRLKGASIVTIAIGIAFVILFVILTLLVRLHLLEG